MNNTITQNPKFKVGQIVHFWDGIRQNDALLIAGIKDEFYMVINLNDAIKGIPNVIYELLIEDVDTWTYKTWNNYYELRNANIKVDYESNKLRF